MKISNWVLLLFFLTFFSSCVTNLPINELNYSVPVVNCVLTNDSIQRLSLTQSVKVNASYIFKEIKDAAITLSIHDSIVGSFTRLGYDNWQLKYTPQSGKIYCLKVALTNGKVLTATTVMPKRNLIHQTIAIDKYPSKNFIQYTAGFPCWITVLTSDSLLLPTSRPKIKDIARDEIGTNHPFADRFNQYGNLLEFIPSADTPKFNYYIRIKPDLMNDSIPFKLQTNYGFHTFICFRTASIEYDNYLKTSLQKITMRLDDTDPIIWFDESKVFSNITNGTGIFAAYSDQFFNYNDDNTYFDN